MPALNAIIDFLSSPRQQAEPTQDEQLLARFLDERDESAFEMLMRRHGPMVFGVCRRIVRNAHDAEDACQTVFLVLARKAHSIRKAGSLSSWLHGVAWHVSKKMLASQARRSAHERSAQEDAERERAKKTEPTFNDVLQLIDEELQRLPGSYRSPLVLCYLQGKTQDEAARELGWTTGALRGRLQRGLAKLQSRLVRRGVTGASAVGLAALGAGMANAAAPSALVATTTQASVAIAHGEALPVLLKPYVVRLSYDAVNAYSAFTGAALVATACALASVSIVAMQSDSTPTPQPEPIVPQVAEVRLANVAGHRWKLAHRFQTPSDHLWTIAFSPDGQRFATGGGGTLPSAGELRIYDAATREFLTSVATPRSVRAIAYAPDGKTLVTVEHDEVTRLRDARTARVLHEFRHPTNNDSAAFAPDGKTLGTACWDGSIRIWDVDSKKLLYVTGPEKAQLFAVAMGPNGLAASGGASGMPRVFRVGQKGGPTTPAPIHLDPIITLDFQDRRPTVHWLAFSSVDGTLATASWDRTVRLWDPINGAAKATLEGHANAVLTVAFSQDGLRLVSSGGPWGGAGSPNVASPGEAIIWNLATRKAEARLPHADRVFGIAFSPDGNTLATACWDGSVALWTRVSVDEATTIAATQFIVAQTPPEEEPQSISPPTKTYQKEFHPKLSGEAAPEKLTVYGPDAKDVVSFDAGGMKLKLPQGYPVQRPGTGVEVDFGLRGDFDITMRYEMEKEPELPTSRGADLHVSVSPASPVVAEVWAKAHQNRALLARESAGGGHGRRFHVSHSKWANEIPKDKWGNEQFHNVETWTHQSRPATSNSGRLRLTRSGPTLYYSISEGDGDTFTVIHKETFGTTDIKSVRVLGTTGGPEIALDAVISDLHIRADDFVTAPTATPTITTPPPRRWWPVVAGSAIAIFLVTAAGIIWSRRPPVVAASLTPPTQPSNAAFISFPCSCGKKLKVKADRAGATVKCPQCQQPVKVPGGNGGKP